MVETYISVVIPWIITVCYVVVLAIFLVYIPKIITSFWRLPLFVRVLFLLIVAGALLVRFYMVPNTHRIYYDEDRYLSYSVTFARFGQAKSIVYVSDGKLHSGFPDKALRSTIPVLNAWVFKILGYTEENVFMVAKIASVVQVGLIFTLAYLLFGRHVVALFAAVGMAFLPNLVFWSPSVGLDLYFALFTMLAFVAACLYAKTTDVKNGLLLVASVFLLLCVRLESFLFLPMILGLISILRHQNRRKLYSNGDLPYVLFALFLIGLRALASISVLGQKWCCAEALPLEAFYPTYFIRNTMPNVSDLFTRREFPFLISVFAIAAILKMKTKKILLLGVWFVAFFITYSTYYAGMFYTHEFSGSYGRYFLILTPPILLLAGVSLDEYISYLVKMPKGKFIWVSMGSVLFVLITLLPMVRSYKSLISKSPFFQFVDEGPVALHDFVQNYMVPNTPADSIVLTSIASYPLMTGRSGGVFGTFLEDPEVRDLVIADLKNGKRVFSTGPYGCVREPEQCNNVDDFVVFEPVVTEKSYASGVQFAEIKLKK